MHPPHSNRFSQEQRRRYQRFSICSSVRIGRQAGESTAYLEAVSKNLSCGGVLVCSPCEIPLSSVVIFTMNIERDCGLLPVRIVAEGETIRLKENADSTFSIAVQFLVPVTEIESQMGFVWLKSLPPAST